MSLTSASPVPSVLAPVDGLALEHVREGRVRSVRVPLHAGAYERTLLRLSESALAALLLRKDEDDPVPMPVWWRVAEALRDTATASLIAQSPTVVTHELAAAHLAHAALEARLAAAQLVAECGLVPGDAGRFDLGPQAAGAVHDAGLRLARLLLSEDATGPALLRARLEWFTAAVAAWREVLIAQE